MQNVSSLVGRAARIGKGKSEWKIVTATDEKIYLKNPAGTTYVIATEKLEQLHIIEEQLPAHRQVPVGVPGQTLCACGWSSDDDKKGLRIRAHIGNARRKEQAA